MALMRRQSLVKFDAPLCETIVDTPKPQGREVLVRIERCGLCHSDLHIQDGYADLGGGKKLDTTRGMTLPFTLGTRDRRRRRRSRRRCSEGPDRKEAGGIPLDRLRPVPRLRQRR